MSSSPNETPALSFILCCFNSEEQVPKVLRHLADQRLTDPYEVVVVDNASTDDTRKVSERLVRQLFGVNGHVASESIPGRINAMLRGIRESKGSVICFVDDDNLLDPQTGSVVLRFFRSHPRAGAVGGESRLPDGMTVPEWFPAMASAYAVGPQFRRGGRVEEPDRGLWGAALAIRREALEQLAIIGWRPVLRGRTGKELSAGEDSELVAAIRLLGWEIWYVPEITLQHAIEPSRLTIDHLVRMSEGFGKAAAVLHEYRFRLGAGYGWQRVVGSVRRIPTLNLLWLGLRYVIAAVVASLPGVHVVTRIRARILMAFCRGHVGALLSARERVRRARDNAEVCHAAGTSGVSTVISSSNYSKG